MESTPSGSSRNLVIALALIAVIFCGCTACVLGGLWAAGLATFATSRAEMEWPQIEIEPGFGVGRVEAASDVQETFDLGPGGRLILDIDVGDVRIEGSDGSEVVVEGRIEARGRTEADAQANLDRVRLDMRRDGRTVRVTADVDQPAGGWGGSSPRVTLRVRVPRPTALDLTTDVGGVRVEATEGDVAVVSDVGDIVLVDARVEEQMTIETDVGAITMEGPLTDGARYAFESDVGRITLRLPADSRFELEAESGIGRVDVDFEVEGDAATPSLVGSRVEGDVNGGGRTSVAARSNVGAVDILRR